MTEANDLVVYSGSRLITTSLKISHQFGREHKSVLRSIQDLECSDEFKRCNFAPVGYTDGKGETRPSYDITRDGFMILAMGFTGGEAMRWKERFIAAFNKVESELLQQRLSDAGEAKELKKQLEACHKRLMRSDKSAQKIARLQGLPDLTRRERAQFSNMTIDRFSKELAELQSCGLVDRAPVNQRMLEMAKKGHAALLAKKAAAVAEMAKQASIEGV